MGGVELTFAELSATSRKDVVLPEAVLARIERHAIDVSSHRQALLDARQHLKRGILVEDVDLVAEDRSFGHDSNPVLFDLLDAMDGAAADADLLFLLTTNRADMLKTALAARPGRVDVAVKVDLPDAHARGRLFALYSRSVPIALSDAQLKDVIARTDGVTASFLKELVRRAVLESLADQSPLLEVSAEHVGRALDELLDSTQQITRTLLGGGTA